MQVPAEKRIKVADTLRLLFHYFNIVNLTLGLIVFGVGVSLTVSPLPIEGASKEISVIYGTLLITAVVVILMGVLGIHGCYWVQENGLKLYAVSTIIAIVLEAGLGSMSIVKEPDIKSHIASALETFRNMSYNPDTGDLTEFRLGKYSENASYRSTVDSVHTVLSCCSFPHTFTNITDIQKIASCFASPYHQVSKKPLPACTVTFNEYITIKLTYIRCLAFMLVPIQLFCLGFDLMVLKTLQVTKDYDKLERELSNRKREKRNSHGYTAVSDVDAVKITPGSRDI